ncbi:hypothetical protein G6F64_015652 [Rhizopus arrhizus]|uniref:Uncharacterized protein n=1 Tax=Rhizopus oryzae TaxID=64495 RepID=A0A9P6WQL7_RHIOR|nr:hypothetical protein G6F64_015652 [Rhizopus arrhizus]
MFDTSRFRGTILTAQASGGIGSPSRTVTAWQTSGGAAVAVCIQPAVPSIARARAKRACLAIMSGFRVQPGAA